MRAASRLCKQVLPFTCEGGALREEVSMPSQSIASTALAL